MSPKKFVCGMILLGSFVLSFGGIKFAQADSVANTKTLTLYDSASGAIPDPSLMSFGDFPFGGLVPTYSDGATVLDTTSQGNEPFAGWVASAATSLGFPILDHTDGIQVVLTVQVESESHTRDTRSGLSLIVLDKEKRGIELSFGENEIWAKSDDNTGGLFARGEDVAFATTNMTVYQLIIAGDTYTLIADGQPLLTGPIRDYSAFDGFPDPYETPNFLFLGDNTTSAQARIRLQFVSITGSEPIVPTNTIEPLPTLLPQSSPTTVPAPLPAPTQPVVVLCPSGWLAAIGAAGIVINTKFRKWMI